MLKIINELKKKILKLIKQDKKENIKQNIIEEKIDKVVKPTPKMFNNYEKEIESEIINYSKLLDNIDSIKKSQLEILYVTMDEKEINRCKIEGDHQSRPFIKINEDIDNQKIYGYYLTGSINGITFSEQMFKRYRMVLSKNKYKLKKNSLVRHDKLIELPMSNIKVNVDFLDIKDTINLLKLSTLIRGFKIQSEGESKLLNIGDIIEHNKKDYIIYQTDNTNIYGINIKKTKIPTDIAGLEDNNYHFLFNNTIYEINHNELIRISANDNITIKDVTTLETVEEISQKRKDYKYIQKMKTRK